MSAIKNFVSRCMRLIDGQQMLPQDVFRSFVGDVDSEIDRLDTALGATMKKEDISVNVSGDIVITIDGTEYIVSTSENTPNIIPNPDNTEPGGEG